MAHWYRYVIVEFKRSPDSFRQTADLSEEMEPWRWPLIIAELPLRSPTGAKMFVAPEVYDPVLRGVLAEGLLLRPRHVIMDPEAVNALQRALQAVPGKDQVRPMRTRQGWANIAKAVPRPRMPFAYLLPLGLMSDAL